jgi:hypothetical protein
VKNPLLLIDKLVGLGYSFHISFQDGKAYCSFSHPKNTINGYTQSQWGEGLSLSEALNNAMLHEPRIQWIVLENKQC